MLSRTRYTDDPKELLSRGAGEQRGSVCFCVYFYSVYKHAVDSDNESEFLLNCCLSIIKKNLTTAIESISKTNRI